MLRAIHLFCYKKLLLLLLCLLEVAHADKRSAMQRAGQQPTRIYAIIKHRLVRS